LSLSEEQVRIKIITLDAVIAVVDVVVGVG